MDQMHWGRDLDLLHDVIDNVTLRRFPQVFS